MRFEFSWWSTGLTCPSSFKGQAFGKFLMLLGDQHKPPGPGTTATMRNDNFSEKLAHRSTGHVASSACVHTCCVCVYGCVSVVCGMSGV